MLEIVYTIVFSHAVGEIQRRKQFWHYVQRSKDAFFLWSADARSAPRWPGTIAQLNGAGCLKIKISFVMY